MMVSAPLRFLRPSFQRDDLLSAAQSDEVVQIPEYLAVIIIARSYRIWMNYASKRLTSEIGLFPYSGVTLSTLLEWSLRPLGGTLLTPPLGCVGQADFRSDQ
jgi:hypothetical protein